MGPGSLAYWKSISKAIGQKRRREERDRERGGETP